MGDRPALLIVINGIAVMNELYTTYEQRLIAIARDGLRVGIMRFLLAARDEYELHLLDMAKLFNTFPKLCAQETQEDTEALELFDTLLDHKEDPPQKQLLIFISGIAGFLMRSDPQKATIAKIYLKHLRQQEGAVFVLFDAVNDATYSMEEWFKNQLSPKDGIWVGEGIDSQSSIQTTYGLGEKVDPQVKKDRGYIVTGGKMRKVKFISQNKSAQAKG